MLKEFLPRLNENLMEIKMLYETYYKVNSKTRTCIDTLNVEKLLKTCLLSVSALLYLYHTSINFYNEIALQNNCLIQKFRETTQLEKRP